MIVDASVAVSWYVEQEGSALAEELRRTTEKFTAPIVIIAEVANALLRKVRFGFITESTYRAILTSELAAEVTYWEDLASLATDAAELSLHHGGAIYDNCYVALARQLGVPLATADRRQAEVAGKVGVEIKLIG